jgi:WD40 repeat protein
MTLLRAALALALALPALLVLRGGAGALSADPPQDVRAEPVLCGSWDLRHRDPVTFLAFTADRLLSGGLEGDVRTWNPADGSLAASDPSAAGSPLDAVLLADGELLVTRGGTGYGTLVRQRSGAVVADDVGTILSASADGTRACVGGRDGSARIVDLATGRVTFEVELGELLAGPSAFVPGTDLVIVLGTNRNKLLGRGGTQDQALSALVVLDAATGKQVRRIELADRALRALAVSLGGSEGARAEPEIIAVDHQGDVRAWRVSDGELRGAWELARPAGAARTAANALALAPNGGQAAIALESGEVVLVSLADGAEQGRVRLSQNPLSAIAVAPDGRTLAASAGFEIFLCDLPALTRRAPSFRHAGPVSALAWSPDGTRLSTGSYDRGARVWNAADAAGVLALDANPGFVYGVALAEAALAAGGQDGHLRLFALDGELRADVAAHAAACTAVALSPDGKMLATAGADGTVRLFYPETGEPQAVLTDIPGIELRLAWFADGRRLAVAAADVRVIDVASASVAAPIGRPSAPVTALAVSPDGKTIAAGLADRTIALYPTDGAPAQFLHGHAGRVTAVAFAPDGSELASASADETGVQLWDPVTRTKVRGLVGFRREVLALAYSPSGDRLAAGSMDGTARIWLRR